MKKWNKPANFSYKSRIFKQINIYNKIITNPIWILPLIKQKMEIIHSKHIEKCNKWNKYFAKENRKWTKLLHQKNNRFTNLTLLLKI